MDGTQSRRFCNVISHKRVKTVTDCFCLMNQIAQKINMISRKLTKGEQFAIVVSHVQRLNGNIWKKRLPDCSNLTTQPLHTFMLRILLHKCSKQRLKTIKSLCIL